MITINCFIVISDELVVSLLVSAPCGDSDQVPFASNPRNLRFQVRNLALNADEPLREAVHHARATQGARNHFPGFSSHFLIRPETSRNHRAVFTSPSRKSATL